MRVRITNETVITGLAWFIGFLSQTRRLLTALVWRPAKWLGRALLGLYRRPALLLNLGLFFVGLSAFYAFLWVSFDRPTLGLFYLGAGLVVMCLLVVRLANHLLPATRTPIKSD